MEWEPWRESWRGWDGGLLLGAVVAYDRSEMQPGRDGLRRRVVTGKFWRGYLRGEPMGTECASPAAAMAVVDAAHAGGG